MSDNSRSRITITLGDSRQVVKRAGPPLDGSFGDSQSMVGRKRSVKDRLGGVGDSKTGFDNKRLRADGRAFSQVDSTADMGLRKSDLRFKLLRKNSNMNCQSNDQQSVLDLRDLLSRPAQSSNASVAALPNIPERSDARQRFPELGNGKQHMSDMRQRKQNMAESRNGRQNMVGVNDVRPRLQETHSSGIIRRIPSTSVAGSLNHVGMLRNSSSPWTSNNLRSPDVGSRPRSPNAPLRGRSPDVGLRRRSPDVALRRRSPDVALRRRSPEVALRRSSPNVAFGRRSPDVAFGRSVGLRRRSPDVAFRRRSPNVALSRRSPGVVLRRRSPDLALRRRSPDVPLRRSSPDVALRRRFPDVALRRGSPIVSLRRGSPIVSLRRRSPDVSLRRRSPGVALRRRSPVITLRHRSPAVALRHRSPDVALRRRSPDVALRHGSPDVLSTPRGYSPPRREEELQRGPSVRSYNDRGVGAYMSKDVHDLSRPHPSVPYMTAAASPAARAYMSKDVYDNSHPRTSVPYMTTTAVPAVHAKPMIPQPSPSMPPSNFIQRSSYVIHEPPTVDSFLRSLGLEKFSIIFKAEEVDMYSLRQMGDNDLKDMGIPMGPRKKLLLELQSRYKRPI
ncbi:hypothetical protein LIER_26251 [Lithospermum erythrorhizon]|uniref:SAM domain-containing protein n=1 Tax=Lithospermum erythrorhizon TaxID=34254 RepID=A0AAV3R7X9_LITER